MRYILIGACLLVFTACSALASEQKNSFALNATNFLSDYIEFLYDVKKAEDPGLARKLRDASRSKSDESFITTWIQYSHRLEEALTSIRPHTTNPEPGIRKITRALIIQLDYITSGINRVISLVISDGAEAEAVKKEIEKLSKRTKLFFGQLQVSAVDIISAIKADDTGPQTGQRGCKLSYKQLKMIDSEMNLFIGDDLLELEEIGLENLIFGEEAGNITLPHYMWTAIFIKVYIDKVIDQYEADKIIGE